MKLKVVVRVWGLYSVGIGVAKHFVTSHFDVKGVIFAIAEARREDPLNALSSTSKALQGLAVLGPHKAFIVGVPVELNLLLLEQIRRHLELDFKPMCRPTWTKRLSNFGRFELVGCSFLEGRARKIWGGIDGELHMFFARCTPFIHGPFQHVISSSTRNNKVRSIHTQAGSFRHIDHRQ